MPQLSPHMYKKEDAALVLLSSALREGSLSVCLGAGISSAMGLPAWHTLVNSCCEVSGIEGKYSKKSSNEDLRGIMDEVERKAISDNRYKSLVHDALYKDFLGVDVSVMSKPLLVALGALISGSVRGSVTDVLTLNFDNILEEYLRIYGMKSQSIHKMPQMLRKADVHIYHLHGYLPHNQPREYSNKLTFSKKSYDIKLAKDERDPMWEVIVNMLTTRLVLFVGLSGNDITFGPIFEDAKKRNGSNNVVGIWLFGKEPSANQLAEIEAWNCVPLVLPSFNYYPEFIFRICEKAAMVNTSTNDL